MKISSTYPQINLNWLISGRGDMLIQEPVAEPPKESPGGLDYTMLKNVIVEAIKEATK